MAQCNIFQLLRDCEYVRDLTLVEIQPEAAKQKYEYGSMPLHYACCYEAPVEVVDALLHVWPEAAKEKEYYGWMPLHYASWKGAPFEVADALLRVCPDAVKAKGRCGKMPLHYVCISSRDRASFEVVKLLLSSWLSHKDNTTNAAILALQRHTTRFTKEDVK
eukprot:4584429-Ditylum_brightwellii.AAC.1